MQVKSCKEIQHVCFDTYLLAILAFIFSSSSSGVDCVMAGECSAAIGDSFSFRSKYFRRCLAFFRVSESELFADSFTNGRSNL